VEALRCFDALYPQANGESPVQQLAIQLATPEPCDLEETCLAEYKNLAPAGTPGARCAKFARISPRGSSMTFWIRWMKPRPILSPHFP